MNRLGWLVAVVFFSFPQVTWGLDIQWKMPLDGYYRSGHYLAVQLDLYTSDTPFSGEVQLHVYEKKFTAAVDIPGRSHRRVWLYPIIVERHSLQLVTVDTAGEVERWTELDREMAAKLKRVEGWEFLGARYFRRGREVPPLDWGDYQVDMHPALPPESEGLSGVDGVMVHHLPATAARKVLLQWVIRGGWLVLARREWRRDFGLTGEDTDLGLGYITVAEPPGEPVGRSFVWARGRLDPREDSLLFITAPSGDLPDSLYRYYLAYFLLFGGLVLFLGKVVAPRLTGTGEMGMWFSLVAGGVVFGWISFPGGQIVADQMAYGRGVTGKRAVAVEENHFFRSLSRPQIMDWTGEGGLIRPLYYQRREARRDKLVVSRSKVEGGEVTSRGGRIFTTRSVRLLPGPLEAVFLSPEKILFRNLTGMNLSRPFLIRGQNLYPIGSFDSQEERVVEVGEPVSLDRLSPGEKEKPRWFQQLKYAFTRFVDPQKFYLLAWSAPPPFTGDSPQIIEKNTYPTVWIFELRNR